VLAQARAQTSAEQNHLHESSLCFFFKVRRLAAGSYARQRVTARAAIRMAGKKAGFVILAAS
jgi:hypothetical protein